MKKTKEMLLSFGRSRRTPSTVLINDISIEQVKTIKPISLYMSSNFKLDGAYVQLNGL